MDESRIESHGRLSYVEIVENLTGDQRSLNENKYDSFDLDDC